MNPYKMKRQRNPDGGYTWSVWDVTTDCVIRIENGRSPVWAPARLKETLDRLNQRYVVDKILVKP